MTVKLKNRALAVLQYQRKDRGGGGTTKTKPKQNTQQLSLTHK